VAGTKQGGYITRDKNLAKDPDYYKKLGSRGGSRRVATKGFGHPDIDAHEAGRKGGTAPRRRIRYTEAGKPLTITAKQIQEVQQLKAAIHSDMAVV